MRNISEEELRKVIAIKRKAEGELLNRDGITGVGVGYKMVKGKLTDEIAIRIYVKEKITREALAPAQLLPESIEDIKTDVIKAEFHLQEEVLPQGIPDRTRRWNPMVGGISVGNPRITAGTLGAKVFDCATGQEMILSNWHILGGKGCRRGEPIWQPAKYDNGTSNDKVADLERWSHGGEVDCAVAKLDTSRRLLSEILEIGVITDVASPYLGMEVKKSGRTTGVTSGVIDDIDVSALDLISQIRIIPKPGSPPNYEISAGGDSGSIWLNLDNRAVGLHFAGEAPQNPKEYALANRITSVARVLDIRFV